MERTRFRDLETIRFEPRGRVGLLTLDRPERLNAISARMMDEVEAVLDAVTEDVEADFGSVESAGGDELYDQAVALVMREHRASTSFIQRHLQIGYNRAARIIEQIRHELRTAGPA